MCPWISSRKRIAKTQNMQDLNTTEGMSYELQFYAIAPISAW